MLAAHRGDSVLICDNYGLELSISEARVTKCSLGGADFLTCVDSILELPHACKFLGNISRNLVRLCSEGAAREVIN